MGHWRDLDVDHYPHEPFLARIWELRANVSAYDAVYVALAETLSTVLVTGDRRLAGAPGVRTRIELVKAVYAKAFRAALMARASSGSGSG